MAKDRLEVSERDEAGNAIATYVQSTTNEGKDIRVDKILLSSSKTSWQKSLDVFLPAGYPLSVTDDYLEYQIYDSLQAFSSSIAGLLSSRAVLSSVGVGDSSASPTAALLLSVLQESAGRIATILFAHRFGTALEPECKMYRLLADVLNDLAFILDCLSPALPKGSRVLLLSFSSVLRALCGVAAGSAKASLSAHFARCDNLGELNAKDASQETVVSLLGMLAGSAVVYWITTPTMTWTVLLLLLSVHLETNRRAVRAVSMRTLNRQRATLVFHHLRRGHVPSPEEVATQEIIFERDGVLRGEHGEVLGSCAVGVSMSRFLRALSSGLKRPGSGSWKFGGDMLSQVMSTYSEQGYALWVSGAGASRHYDVVVKSGATSRDVLTAWWQALMLSCGEGARADDQRRSKDGVNYEVTDDAAVLEGLRRSLNSAAEMLKKHELGLRSLGWDLNSGVLETSAKCRIVVE